MKNQVNDFIQNILMQFKVLSLSIKHVYLVLLIKCIQTQFLIHLLILHNFKV